MLCTSYKWHFEEKPLLSPDACFSLTESDYKEDKGDGAGDGGVSSLTLKHMATITVWGAMTLVFQTSLYPCCLFLFSLLFLFLTPRFSSPHRLTLMSFADWFCLSFRGPFWPRRRKRNQPNIRVFFHTCLFIFLNQMTDLFKCATERCASPSLKWNVNEKRHAFKKYWFSWTAKDLESCPTCPACLVPLFHIAAPAQVLPCCFKTSVINVCLKRNIVSIWYT